MISICVKLIGAGLAAVLLVACEEPAATYSPATTYSAPAPPYVPPFDYRAASNRLQPNMSEAQVAEILGKGPGSTQLLTCGGALGKPWSCRAATYGPLNVHYYWNSNTGSWRVASWYFS